jgi:hypothetical protein
MLEQVGVVMQRVLDIEFYIIQKSKSSRYLDLLSVEEKFYLDRIFYFVETYKHKVKCLLSNTFSDTFCLNCGIKNKVPYDYIRKSPKVYCSNICSLKSSEGRIRNSIAQKNRKKNPEHSNLAKKRYSNLLNKKDFLHIEKNANIEDSILSKRRRSNQYHTILSDEEASYLNSFWGYACTIKEKVFLMENDIRERPRCLNCGEQISSPFISCINKKKYLKRFCKFDSYLIGEKAEFFLKTK